MERAVGGWGRGGVGVGAGPACFKCGGDGSRKGVVGSGPVWAYSGGGSAGEVGGG